MPKAIRILVYEGDSAWLTHVLSRSHISPEKPLIGKVISIKEVYRDTFPDIAILPEITIDEEVIDV